MRASRWTSGTGRRAAGTGRRAAGTGRRAAAGLLAGGLTAGLALSETSGTAARGAFLAFVYGLGLGIPFLIVAFAFQRAVNVLGFFRRNARLVSRIGGAMLVIVGILEVTGAWTAAINWMRDHWIGSYQLPL